MQNSFHQVIFDQTPPPKLYFAQKINQCRKKLRSNMANFEKYGKIPIRVLVHLFEIISS
jgi:hypothetical protein